MYRYCLIFLVLFLVACGGRIPTPVIVHQVGDVDKTCEELAYELDIIEKKVLDLLVEEDRAVRNLYNLGAALLFSRLNIIFMDLSQAGKHEATALHKRYGYLLTIAKRKDCLAANYDLPPLPEPPARTRQKPL